MTDKSADPTDIRARSKALVDEDRRRRTKIFEESDGTAPDYGRQIPPPLNPFVAGMVARLMDGYESATARIKGFQKEITELVEAGKLDPVEQAALLTQHSALQDAIDTAAEITGGWKSAGPDADKITPEVHRIADYAKFTYAVGSRDIVALVWRLAELADAGRLDIEAHNRLQHDLTYGMGEGIYHGTISALHDENVWDGGWDWDDNHYSDGRVVILRAGPRDLARRRTARDPDQDLDLARGQAVRAGPAPISRLTGRGEDGVDGRCIEAPVAHLGAQFGTGLLGR